MTEKVKVKFGEIEMAIDSSQDYMFATYVHKRTGEIVAISDEDGTAVEGEEDELDEDCPEWQKETRKEARKVLRNREDYVDLPTKYDFDDYSVMQRLCRSIGNQSISDQLCDAIRGSGAFRRFKSQLSRFGLVDEWGAFHSQALKDFARRWCEENGMEFVDDQNPPKKEGNK